MTLTIYHNPRCSKSRATLKLLEDHGAHPEVVAYLDTPPSTAELSAILTALGSNPRDILRKTEPAYKELNLKDDTLSDAALLAAMHANPKLIERPIVVTADGRAAIGRPPENVLDLLEAPKP